MSYCTDKGAIDQEAIFGIDFINGRRNLMQTELRKLNNITPKSRFQVTIDDPQLNLQ